ncbi:MAG: thioredoxin domain-containing protein [Parvularculaceae bacterium]
MKIDLARFKNLAFIAIIAAGVSVFAFTGRDTASGAEYTLDREPEVVAATFASAWCSTCKILQPRLAKVIPDFKDQPVKFVELDFTYGQGDSVEQKAAAEGLAEIYPRFKGATGFTLLVDRDTGEIIDSLTINYDQDAMRAAIARAIAVAEQSGRG